MSQAAQEYYQERAERYEIEEIPRFLLSNEPAELFPKDHYVPLHMPEASRNSIPSLHLRNLLEKAGSFALDCAQRDEEFPHYSYGVSNNVESLAETYAEKLLIPKVSKSASRGSRSMSTGKLTDVTLEAITHDELPEAILARLRKDRFPGVERDGLLENTEVYLKLTGEIKSGARPGPVGAIIMPHAVHVQKWSGREPMVTSIRYASTPVSTNNPMGRSLIGDSRATARIVEGHNISRAITSPNGNNRRQDGR